jgi:hypothetical protein
VVIVAFLLFLRLIIALLSLPKLPTLPLRLRLLIRKLVLSPLFIVSEAPLAFLSPSLDSSSLWYTPPAPSIGSAGHHSTVAVVLLELRLLSQKTQFQIRNSLMGGVGSFHSPQSGIKEKGSKIEDVLRPSFSPTWTPQQHQGRQRQAVVTQSFISSP